MKREKSFAYIETESEYRRQQEGRDDRFKAILVIIIFLIFLLIAWKACQ